MNVQRILAEAGILGQFVIQLLNVRNPQEHRNLLSQNPMLLEEATETLLQRMLEAEPHEQARQLVRRHITLLRQCRELGIDTVFDNMGDNTDIPDTLMQLIQQAKQAEQTFLQSNNQEALNSACQCWQQIWQQAQFNDLPLILQNVLRYNGGRVFLQRYEAAGKLVDLQRAIDVNEQIVEFTPPDSTSLPMYLNSLGNSLRAIFARNGDMNMLQRAIDVYERAVELSPSHSADSPIYLNNLGASLGVQFEHSGDLSKLQEAINVIVRAVELTPPKSPDLPLYFGNLGNSMKARYKHTDHMNDLQQAIDNYEKAVQLTPPNSPSLPSRLNNLSNGLKTRFDRTNDTKDLQNAIELSELAIKLTHPNSVNLPMYLNSQSTCLKTRFEHSGNLNDLHKAIAVYKQAVKLAQPNSPSLPGYLFNLGTSLSIRFEHTKDINDLHQAINISERSTTLTPPNSPDLPFRLSSLGNALKTRFKYIGDISDLQHAINVYEQAIKLSHPNSSDLPLYLNNLGTGLSIRYEHTGKLSDLHQAIDVFERAVKLIPQQSPTLPGYLNNLGNGLTNRFVRYGDIDDLQQAISIHEQAVNLTPPSSPDLPLFLNNQGYVLRIRFKHYGDFDDIQHAIAIFRQAIKLCHPNSIDLPGYLTNLGSGLSLCFERTGNLTDLEQAIDVFEQAVNLTPSNSPDLPMYLNNLGYALRTLFKTNKKPLDLESAIKQWGKVCATGMYNATEAVITSSRYWGNALIDQTQWQPAVEAYTYGINAMKQLYNINTQRSSKSAWLKEVGSVPSNMAYAQAKMERVIDAVVTLETNRARLFAEVMERGHVDLERVKEEHKPLYNRYIAATNHVQMLQNQELNRYRESQTEAFSNETVQEAIDKMNSTILAIQKQADPDFLAPVKWEDIQSTVVLGQTLVYVLSAIPGGLALIVTPEKVIPLWLAEFREETLHEKVFDWLGAYDYQLNNYYKLIHLLKDKQSSENDLLEAISNLNSAEKKWQECIKATIDWLSHDALSKLTEKLDELNTKQVTLIPVGLSSLLPIHVIDEEIIFTYTPNAMALGQARNIAQSIDSTTLDLFAAENPANDPNIAELAKSVQDIKNHFTNCWHVKDTQGTVNTALQAMQQCNVFHFYTHGNMDRNDALDSGLEMYGGRLKLRDILALDGIQARLAFLAACETNIPDISIIDEVVSLPTGFLQAGVAGVVGTLWSVNAESTAELTRKFYEYWLEDGDEPPVALHRAQRYIRDCGRGWEHPYYWAGFTYSGV